MKKNIKIIALVLVLLAIITAISITAVINKNKNNNGTMELDSTDVDISLDDDNFTVQAVNPFEFYESIEYINGISGTGIKKCTLTGISDEVFAVVDGRIAEYKFVYNNIEFCVRGSKTEDDISGIYVGNGTISDLVKEDGKLVNSDGILFIRWHSNNIQYVISAMSTDKNIFEDVYDNIK